jgi:hypothetical protein
VWTQPLLKTLWQFPPSKVTELCINCIKNRRFYFSLVFHTPLSGRIFARHHLTQWKNSSKTCKVHALKDSFPLMKKEKDGWKFVQMNEKKLPVHSLQRIMAALLALPRFSVPALRLPAISLGLPWPPSWWDLETWKSSEGRCHYPTPNSTFVAFGV